MAHELPLDFKLAMKTLYLLKFVHRYKNLIDNEETYLKPVAGLKQFEK